MPQLDPAEILAEHLRAMLTNILAASLSEKMTDLLGELERRQRPEGATNRSPTLTTLERAFQLAESGEFNCVAALVKRLDHEGYDGRQIHGPLLRRRLRELINRAR